MATRGAAVVQCVCCTTSSFDSPLNVRDAPSTSGNILGQVKYFILFSVLK